MSNEFINLIGILKLFLNTVYSLVTECCLLCTSSISNTSKIIFNINNNILIRKCVKFIRLILFVVRHAMYTTNNIQCFSCIEPKYKLLSDCSVPKQVHTGIIEFSLIDKALLYFSENE